MSAPLIPRCRPQSAQLHVEARRSTHFHSRRRGFSWYGSRFFRSPSPRCTLKRRRWSCMEPQSASDFAHRWTDGGAVLGSQPARPQVCFAAVNTPANSKMCTQTGRPETKYGGDVVNKYFSFSEKNEPETSR